MTSVRLTDRAEAQLEEIFEYTEKRWGLEQAEKYSRDILAMCAGLGDRSTISRPIPAELGVGGFVARYGNHCIYWRQRDDGDIDVSAILHERMHQAGRLSAALAGEGS